LDINIDLKNVINMIQLFNTVIPKTWQIFNPDSNSHKLKILIKI